MDPEGVLKVNGSGSVLPHGPLPHSRPHCVSWSAGSAPHRAVPPPLLVPGPTLAEEFSNPAVIGHLGGSQRLSASPVSVRKMLLSLLDSSGEARYQPLSQRSPPVRRGAPTSREGPRSDSDSSEDNPAARHSADSDDGGYNEPGQGGAMKRRNGPQLDPKAGPGLLHRTSAISRRKCLSRPKREAWSLVLQTPDHQAAAPSPNRLRAHSTRASKTPPLDLQPHPPHSPEKPRCVSFSANLNRLLGVGLHLPFRCQEEGHKPRTQSDAQISPGPRKCMDRSENPHTPDSILRASCDLEKENAHFVVADMVLEAVEGAKWAVLSQRGAGVSRWCADCIQENETKNCTPQPIKHSASVGSSDSGYVEWCSPQSTSASSRSPSLIQEQPPPTDANKPETATDSDSSSVPSSSQFPTILCSAEVLALQLVSEFKKQWFAKEDLGTTSLGSALQEFFPDNDSMATEDILALADEIKQKSRMRGTLTWAPPRFQIIFSTHPTQKRSVVVASQHYLCAGCGTQVEDKYLKKLRYCEYLGRYFCDCCHSDGESVIPGHVLEKWDFGRYPVCTFSHQLLDSVWHQPLFSLAWVANNLGSRVRELPRFMEVQEQLLAIKKLLTVCRLSDRVLAELEQLPGHLTQEPVLLSMDDLQRIKRGQLVSQARALLRTAVAHVDSCQVCLARGFICEFCKRKDVLFPFQTESCRRCRDCKACFHIECFRDEKCPKCLRIQTRRTLTDSEFGSLLTEQN